MPQADEELTIVARLIDNITGTMKGISKTTLKAFGVMAKGAQKLTGSIKKIGKSFLSLKGVIASVALKKAFDVTVGAATKFEKQMREVATLSETMADNIGVFSKEVLKLSAESGDSLDSLTKGLFDAVSAGVPAAESMEFLASATKLATGGATNTAVAVDGLTTVINAFSLQASQANDVSDAFFEAMKFGKTTIQELATSIGPLAPTARAAGLGFDQMLGGVSALTKAGFNTREAVIAMQGALVSINALTPEAKSKMDKLGLSYNVTGKEGEGFIDVLNNIVEAGGGSLQGVKELIPNIQGAKGVLALAANEGKNFNEVMKNMANRTGSTGIAFAKMADTMEFKQNRVKQSFNSMFIELGNQLMPAFADFADFILKHMDKIKFGVAFGVALVKDVWSGLSLVFQGTANSIAKAILFILERIDKFQLDFRMNMVKMVQWVRKAINKLPKRFIPQGWNKGLHFFEKSTIETMKIARDEWVISSRALFNLNKEQENFAEKAANSKSALVELLNSGEGIEEKATSVKDLLGGAQTLVPPQQGGGLTQEKKQEMSDEQKEFLENLKQIELEHQERTTEGKLALLEKEHQEMLAKAKKFGEDSTTLTKEFELKKQAIKDKQAALDRKRTQERIKTTQVLVGSFADVTKAMVKSAKSQKTIALTESIIQGALAVSKAVASAPFPLNIPAIAEATAIGVAQTATIASQSFRKGGFPKGRNALVQVNEAGQESILNAQATSQLGSGAINRLNAGRGLNGTVTNEIVYSPTINVGPENEMDVITALENSQERFAEFMEETKARGFFN